jgi:hypothetical protein
MIKNIIQVSKNKQDQYVIDKILQKADGWSYINFTDKEIYDYFSKNKLKNFENIEKKFKEIKNGAHKADIFRICDKIGWSPKVDMREWIVEYANR